MVILGVPPMYRGNQVQVLSSTRYCHLHYEKSRNATERFGKADFSERARKPAMSLNRRNESLGNKAEWSEFLQL